MTGSLSALLPDVPSVCDFRFIRCNVSCVDICRNSPCKVSFSNLPLFLLFIRKFCYLFLAAKRSAMWAGTFPTGAGCLKSHPAWTLVLRCGFEILSEQRVSVPHQSYS